MITNDVDTSLEINWDRLHQISDADAEFELELLHMLAADMEEQLVALQTALQQQDALQLKQLAHYIKGAAANVGVNSISAIASSLEETAVNHKFSDATELLAAMAGQQQQFVIYLQQL
jgi:HPt (histidine-containing phosphotransfer) domain-containing protein